MHFTPLGTSLGGERLPTVASLTHGRAEEWMDVLKREACLPLLHFFSHLCHPCTLYSALLVPGPNPLFAGVRTGPHASSRMPCVGVLGRLGPPSVEAPTWGKGRGEFLMLHFVVLSLCTFLLRLDRLCIVVGHYQAA